MTMTLFGRKVKRMTHDWGIPTLIQVRTTQHGKKYLYLMFESGRYFIQATSYERFDSKDEALFELIKGRVTWDVRETEKPKRMDKKIEWK